MSKKLDKKIEALHEFALGMPDAWLDTPWGEVVCKVRKKVFVFLGKRPGDAERISFSAKLPESGPDLIAMKWGEPTGYGLGASGWVSLRFEPGSEPPHEMLCEWIEESYRTIAPKKLIAELDARASDAEVAPKKTAKKKAKKAPRRS